MDFNIENFNDELKTRKDLIDNCLQTYTRLNPATAPIITEGIAYALNQGGKRLRPIILLEGAVIAGMSIQEALPFSIALEMIHTYSLIHDDLPAMDNDELRRGQPTCHIKFGEANAILIGDALLTDAFALVGKTALDSEIPPLSALKAINLIAEGAGGQGMVSGQALDVDETSPPTDLAALQTLHSLKTGALFKAALLAGASLGRLSEEKYDALAVYAENFGLAFQITDDILDVTQTAEILGKPAGSDAKNQKITYTDIMGIAGARQVAEAAVERCLQSLEIFNDEADFLRSLALYLLQRNN